MTAIKSIIYDYNEGATIRMDNGVDLPAQTLAPLANTVCARDGIYDANMYLEAAWNAAHPVLKGATVPEGTPLIMRDPNGSIHINEGYSFSFKVDGYGHTEYRTLTPLPAPKPESWEEPRFCHANGNFYKRIRNEYGNYWRRTGSNDTYTREDMAKLNPEPVTIGEA